LSIPTHGTVFRDKNGVIINKFEITLFRDELNDPLLLSSLATILQFPTTKPSKVKILEEFSKESMKLLIKDSMKETKAFLLYKLKELLDPSQMNYQRIH